MARPPLPAGAALRTLILDKAATLAGYVASDSRHLPNYEQSARTCERMVHAGLLHPAKVKTRYMRYFTTAAAAANFKDVTKPKSKAQRLAEQRARYAAKLANMVKPPVAEKPKPVKLDKLTYAEVAFLRSVAGKAYTPPAPKRDAVIIWPDHIKPVCRMMGMGRYEASVPFMRIGQPGFAMSVGDAA